MDGPSKFPYEVIEDELFTAQAREIEPDTKKLDERLRYVTWVLARIPHEFGRVRNTNLRRVVHDGNPKLRIWFTFDGIQVVMKSIERYEPNAV